MQEGDEVAMRSRICVSNVSEGIKLGGAGKETIQMYIVGTVSLKTKGLIYCN